MTTKTRHNVYLTAATWAYLNRNGQPSQEIEHLVEAKMTANQNRTNPRTAAEKRIDEMEFSYSEQEFIWADWPNMAEHIMWLLAAPREEIQSWIDANR